MTINSNDSFDLDVQFVETSTPALSRMPSEDCTNSCATQPNCVVAED